MFRTTERFYTENRTATLYVSLAAFAVWALIVTFIAAM